jgi:hypothetical protein
MISDTSFLVFALSRSFLEPHRAADLELTG